MGKINSKIRYIKKHIEGCSTVKAYCIFFDYIYTRLVLRFGMEEYMQYKMYRLRNHAKKEFISEYDVLHRIPATINNTPKKEVFNNKDQFDEAFHQYIGRAHCVIDGDNYLDFASFAQDFDEIIVKPLDSWCGKGVEKLCVKGKDLRETYDSIYKNNGKCLVEEVIHQHEAMAEFNPDSVNTLRVITLHDGKGNVHVPCAAMRIGRKGASIDNFCAGGMAAVIDPNEGVIITGAYDKDNVLYIRHPDSGLIIVGFQVPHWDDVIATVKEAALLIPEVRLIGWDVVVKPNGEVSLIEGNISPGARTIQMPIKEGLRTTYTDILGEF